MLLITAAPLPQGHPWQASEPAAVHRPRSARHRGDDEPGAQCATDDARRSSAPVAHALFPTALCATPASQPRDSSLLLKASALPPAVVRPADHERVPGRRTQLTPWDYFWDSQWPESAPGTLAGVRTGCPQRLPLRCGGRPTHSRHSYIAVGILLEFAVSPSPCS